jgi:hypothetical protein
MEKEVDLTLEPVRIFLQRLGEFLPQLLLAVVILIVGWLLAKLFRFALVKGLRAVNFHVLTERAGIEHFLQQGGVKIDVSGILGILGYWLVIMAAFMVAFNSLGLAHVTELLGRVVLFIPSVIVAILILAFGGYFARFVGGSVTAYCKNVGIQDAELLGRIALWAIMVFVSVIALDQVGIGGDIIRYSFLILLGGVVFALALAFGLGGQKWAAEILARWLPRKDTAGPKDGV